MTNKLVLIDIYHSLQHELLPNLAAQNRTMDTSQYFYRNVPFSKQGQTISVIDLFNPEQNREELEPWFGMVIQLADGQHTVDQLCQFMAAQYNGAPPPNLNETILSVVERLAKNNLIMLVDKPTPLPYYMSMPYEMLDIQKARRELEKDRANMN